VTGKTVGGMYSGSRVEAEVVAEVGAGKVRAAP
jgi:hypothetical protein